MSNFTFLVQDCLSLYGKMKKGVESGGAKKYSAKSPSFPL